MAVPITSWGVSNHRPPRRWPRWSYGILVFVVFAPHSGCAWVRNISRREQAAEMQVAAAESQDSGEGEPDFAVHRPEPQSGRRAKRRWPRLPDLWGRRQRQKSGSEESRSDDPEVYVKLAEEAILTQRLPAARRHVSTALELQPEHARAWLLKGQIEEAAGRQEDAVKAYHRAVSCDALHPEATLRLARIQIDHGRAAHTAQVLRSLTECPRATDDQKSRAQWLLGVAYVRTARWRQAVAALQEGAHRRNLSADDRYLLAMARYKSGDFAGARREVKQQLQTHPDHAQFAALLAELNYIETTRSEILPVQNLVAPEESPEFRGPPAGKTERP